MDIVSKRVITEQFLILIRLKISTQDKANVAQLLLPAVLIILTVSRL